MANTNTTTSVVDTIFARSLLALRENAVLPRYVNKNWSTEPGNKFDTIDVPIPSAISASAVTPSYVPPDDSGVSPTSVSISLNKWYETAFFINDKEVFEIVGGVFEGQLSEAIKGLVNQVESDLFAEYKDVYGYAGAAGTTPFASDLSEASTARQVLATQLAPRAPRFCVVDENAEANLLGLRQIQDLSYRGSTQGLMDGELGQLLGFLFVMDQNVPTHTKGTASGATTDATGYAAGLKTVTLDSAGTGTIVAGDIITFAGDTQTYTVTSGDADVSNGGTISFSPGLKSAIPSSATAITVKGSHVANLAFHRDAFALASRPLAQSDPFGLNPNIRSMVDPVSGLSLAMEITRQHYRTRIALSSLYGVQCVRPELACRIAG